MALALVWNFWPKMVSGGNGYPSMIFDLTWEGTAIPVPDPRTFAPLTGFVAAMDRLKTTQTGTTDGFGQVLSIDAQRPRKHLGRLALQRFPMHLRDPLDAGSDGFGNPIGAMSHHVALMRQAELVVRYVSGPALPSDKLEYAGVFLADAGVDSVFAKAEPPTHDDWISAALETREEKVWVNVALRDINAAMDRFAAPIVAPAPAAPATAQPLGGFADHLGSLLPATGGTGVRIQMPASRASEFVGKESESTTTGPMGADAYAGNVAATDPGNSGGTGLIPRADDRPPGNHTPQRNNIRQRARLTIENEGELAEVNGQPILITRFTVDPATNSLGTRVTLTAGAVLDGGELELEPPIGGQRPVILGWKGPGGRQQIGGAELMIPAATVGDWWVAVGIPDGVMVGLTLTASEER